MAEASAVLDEFYKASTVLRRWSLIGGMPRCVLPPLIVASASASEVAQARAENARVYAAAMAAEAFEAAAATGAPLPDDPNAAELVRLRALPPPEPRMVAVLGDGGAIQAVLAVDPEWSPPEGAEAVPATLEARVGGTYAAGTFTPPVVPPPVPLEVTNFQARALLRGIILPNGVSLETAVTATLRQGREDAAALPEADPVRIEADRAWLAWEQSNVFERHSPLINTIAAAMSVTADDIDEWFRQAAEIAA